MSSTKSRSLRQAEYKSNGSKSSVPLGYVRTDREVGPAYILSGLLSEPLFFETAQHLLLHDCLFIQGTVPAAALAGKNRAFLQEYIFSDKIISHVFEASLRHFVPPPRAYTIPNAAATKIADQIWGSMEPSALKITPQGRSAPYRDWLRATAQKLLPNVPEFSSFVDDLGG